MRVKIWLTSWLIGFCISFGAVSAIVTTFSFFDASLFGLGLYCALLCALCAWAFLTKRGTVILLGLIAALLCYGLLWQGLLHSVQAVAYRISTVYNAAYHWGELDLAADIRAFSPMPAMLFLGALSAVSLTWAVSCRKKLIFPLMIALLPLYPCFVVVNFVPESWCLLLVLAAVLVLILTQTLRRLDCNTGHRITAFALIPAILLSVFLVSSVPKDGYWDEFPALQALVWKNGNQVDTEGPPLIGMPEDNQMELLSAGFPSGANESVMTVRSGSRGLLYLRYQSFDKYNGTQWLATGLPEDPAFWPEEEDLIDAGYISITTTKPYEGMFIPYYSQSGRYLLLQNGMQPNSEKITKYRVAVGYLRNIAYGSGTPDLTPYLALPEATREAALQILRENSLKTPEDILQYVKNSAAYSVMTGPVPEDTEDFAIWFLRNGETGYCVHFATAAAVLLRAAGYPARYVTGYAIMTRARVTVAVKQSHAHAWVEYAEPENGYLWKVLEATPNDPSSELTPPDGNEATEPFAPTQPNTEAQSSAAPNTEPQPPTEPDGADGPEEPVTGVATRPSGQGGKQQNQKQVMDISWLAWLGGVIAVVAALWLQYRVRFRLRQKKLRTGRPNVRALACWREILRLCRLLDIKPPDRLLQLAEKARFSQHELTPKELLQLRQYLHQQRKTVEALPVWKRLLAKLLWAI